MMSVVDVAVAVVRGWTRLYTWRLADSARQLRRNEIESDLWESLHDASVKGNGGPALHLLGRALRGICDDLLWRAALSSAASQRRGLAALVTVGVLLIVAVFLVIDVSTTIPPRVPPAPALTFGLFDAPPPPPPPPEMQGGAHDRNYWRSGATVLSRGTP